jgi:uncharacterized protein
MAFNTDQSVGSIHEVGQEPIAIAAKGIKTSRTPGAWIMASATKLIPPTISAQKYVSLTTFRKNGTKIATPVWFGEEADKLYVMTRSTMGKVKRIRNNPQVEVAPCTVRGKVTGQALSARARILPQPEQAHARQTINRKYWAREAAADLEPDRHLHRDKFSLIPILYSFFLTTRALP